MPDTGTLSPLDVIRKVGFAPGQDDFDVVAELLDCAAEGSDDVPQAPYLADGRHLHRHVHHMQPRGRQLHTTCPSHSSSSCTLIQHRSSCATSPGDPDAYKHCSLSTSLSHTEVSLGCTSKIIRHVLPRIPLCTGPMLHLHMQHNPLGQSSVRQIPSHCTHQDP